MKNTKHMKEQFGKVTLAVVEKYAKRKADSLCITKLYEPKVPSKLKKN